jgi:predicted HTH transcriptional regulator
MNETLNAREDSTQTGQATLFDYINGAYARIVEDDDKRLQEQWSTVRHADICQNRHGGNPESVKANRHVDKVNQSKLVLEALERLGTATCEQLEDVTFSKHQSVSARLSELKRDGLIVKIGTRLTRSNSPCAVYALT